MALLPVPWRNVDRALETCGEQIALKEINTVPQNMIPKLKKSRILIKLEIDDFWKLKEKQAQSFLS